MTSSRNRRGSIVFWLRFYSNAYLRRFCVDTNYKLKLSCNGQQKGLSKRIKRQLPPKNFWRSLYLTKYKMISLKRPKLDLSISITEVELKEHHQKYFLNIFDSYPEFVRSLKILITINDPVNKIKLHPAPPHPHTHKTLADYKPASLNRIVKFV